MKINLLVIRTENPELLKSQYELLGFNFEHHQHGSGPFHYASEEDGFVFEIYPLTKSMIKADHSIRMGFTVQNLEQKIKDLGVSTWKILSAPSNTEWGWQAVIQDLDGRKIELKEK